eukprot:1825655-Rhodomonas_salina.1
MMMLLTMMQTGHGLASAAACLEPQSQRHRRQRLYPSCHRTPVTPPSPQMQTIGVVGPDLCQNQREATPQGPRAADDCL